jgi:hypothetical protein
VARITIPATIICTGYPAEAYQRSATETDWSWLAGIRDPRDVTWVDLPTSHWPMWSRPSELAALIGEYDGYNIWEAPDSVSMAVVAIAISGGGALSKSETTELLTVEETLDALRRAPSVGYRKPGV